MVLETSLEFDIVDHLYGGGAFHATFDTAAAAAASAAT